MCLLASGCARYQHSVVGLVVLRIKLVQSYHVFRLRMPGFDEWWCEYDA